MIAPMRHGQRLTWRSASKVLSRALPRSQSARVASAAGCGCAGRYRWRAESGGPAPARLGEVGRSGRYLPLLERERIATLHRQGFGVREIARIIGRSPSTGSRELRRNMARHGGGRYDGDLAHARARQRARRPRPNRISQDEQLRRIVQALLEQDWSPEQIAAHLRRTYPDKPAWQLCHETIRQALYHGGKGGLSRTLTRRPRTGRPLRKRRRRADARRTRYVRPGTLIDAQPAVVLERSRNGDWEGDLIVGPARRSAIGTLLDRRSGFVRLVHLPDGHNAEQCHLGTAAALGGLPAGAADADLGPGLEDGPARPRRSPMPSPGRIRT